MKRGDLVLCQTFSAGVVERRVVEILRNTVYLCTEEEWAEAIKHGREPECVGFNHQYVRKATCSRSPAESGPRSG